MAHFTYDITSSDCHMWKSNKRMGEQFGWLFGIPVSECHLCHQYFIHLKTHLTFISENSDRLALKRSKYLDFDVISVTNCYPVTSKMPYAGLSQTIITIFWSVSISTFQWSTVNQWQLLTKGCYHCACKLDNYRNHGLSSELKSQAVHWSFDNWLYGWQTKTTHNWLLW